MGDAAAPPTSSALAVGDIVADRYRIEEVLGEGGMGIVYRAEHLHLRKLHALKVLLPEWSTMPEVVARFEREAVAAGNIQSPNVVAATDFGRLPGGSFFLVMEYVHGQTLGKALESGAFPPSRALHILRGIVSALHAAHAKGIVHRDLKPDNVMLVEQEGDCDFVKVLDFGIAKVAFGAAGDTGSGKALTQLGAIIGTPEYMSPEQAMGQPVDARSDLYSAGVIFYEMLAGRRPFGGGAVTVVRQHAFAEVPELPESVASTVDPRLGDILRRLLAKTPETRFASATDLLSALGECEVRPAPAAPARPSLQSVPSVAAVIQFTKRRRVLVAAGLATLAIVALASLLGAGTTGKQAPPATAGPPSASAASPLASTASVSTAPSATTAEPSPGDSAPSIAPLPPPPTRATATATAAAAPPPPRPTAIPAKKNASSQGTPRRTGPGGIYIPPPSQWFK